MNEELKKALVGVEPLAESLGPASPEDALESGEALAFVRDGYPREVLRRLRRGHWAVEASLDLHGMNRLQAAARATVSRC